MFVSIWLCSPSPVLHQPCTGCQGEGDYYPDSHCKTIDCLLLVLGSTERLGSLVVNWLFSSLVGTLSEQVKVKSDFVLEIPRVMVLGGSCQRHLAWADSGFCSPSGCHVLPLCCKKHNKHTQKIIPWSPGLFFFCTEPLGEGLVWEFEGYLGQCLFKANVTPILCRRAEVIQMVCPWGLKECQYC